MSDAGTPLLSDPGFLLVREAAALGYAIEPIPGASAILAALVASGLPAQPFTFTGFPPPKTGKRRTFYRSFATLEHTLVVFESPHRLLPSLDDAIAELGDRRAAIARELTKMHEEVLRGRLSDLRATLGARAELQRGIRVGGRRGFECEQRRRRVQPTRLNPRHAFPPRNLLHALTSS